jgi:uncharacterized protein (TIGR02466 family)
MYIENWFGVPVFFTDLIADDLNLVQNEITSSIENADNISKLDELKTSYKPNQNNLYIEEFKIISLKNIIIKNLNAYRKALNYHNDIEYNYYIESWISFHDNGDRHSEHNHHGCDISGVYYYQTNGDEGNLVFLNPNIAFISDFFPFTGTLKSTIVSYAPVVGRLILFPSWLMHKVEKNNTNNRRIALSFNAQFIMPD